MGEKQYAAKAYTYGRTPHSLYWRDYMYTYYKMFHVKHTYVYVYILIHLHLSWKKYGRCGENYLLTEGVPRYNWVVQRGGMAHGTCGRCRRQVTSLSIYGLLENRCDREEEDGYSD